MSDINKLVSLIFEEDEEESNKGLPSFFSRHKKKLLAGGALLAGGVAAANSNYGRFAGNAIAAKYHTSKAQRALKNNELLSAASHGGKAVKYGFNATMAGSKIPRVRNFVLSKII